MDYIVQMDNSTRDESDSLIQKRNNALKTPETLNPFLDPPVEPENIFYHWFKVCLGAN